MIRILAIASLVAIGLWLPFAFFDAMERQAAIGERAAMEARR